MNDSLHGRYLRLLPKLNEARIIPSRLVVSPEALHEYQTEVGVHSYGGRGIATFEGSSSRSGLSETVFGLPVEVDPRLVGNAVRVEVDI